MTGGVKYYVIFGVRKGKEALMVSVGEGRSSRPEGRLRGALDGVCGGLLGVERPLRYPCLVHESAPGPRTRGFRAFTVVR